jgi:hypothetical protein
MVTSSKVNRVMSPTPVSGLALAALLSLACSHAGGTPQQYQAIGTPCAHDAPTSSVCGMLPKFFCDSDHPNGYCKAVCHGDGDCPAGSVCAGAGIGNPGECHKLCTQVTAASDCRLSEGYVCKAMPVDASHAYCDVPESADGGA